MCTGPGCGPPQAATASRPIRRHASASSGDAAPGARGTRADTSRTAGLVDRLVRAGAAQPRRTVGGQQRERHPSLRRLDDGGEVLGGRRAARARERDRPALAFASPSAKKPLARSSRWTCTRMPRVARQRQRERRRARAGRDARVAHAAADERVDQGGRARERDVARRHHVTARPYREVHVREHQPEREQQAGRRVHRRRPDEHGDQVAAGRRARRLQRLDRQRPRGQPEQPPLREPDVRPSTMNTSEAERRSSRTRRSRRPA